MLNPPLLATKFHKPTIPSRWVKRPHLLHILDEGLHLGRGITLVSAPAGFGKSVCISDWLSGLQGWKSVWCSLDKSDDDPVLFFSCLLTAFQKFDQDLCQDLGKILTSGQLPPNDIFAITLINEVSSLSENCLLVLDDFHIVQDEYIIKVFEKFLPNLPDQFHLVLISREDPPLPLAQIRAQNRMTEIRSNDLRFSHQDAAEFLTRVMNLSLSPHDIEILEQKTEGWVVGLQLAGLSLQGQARSSESINSFSGSHRYILTYLAEQVLERQPDDVRLFLLQTSVLEKLNADLCNAVTHRPDSHWMLERLANANLFLISLDEINQWFRYHHLFADLLREIQKSDPAIDSTELHRRACSWYTENQMLRPAMRHALAAKDFETSVRLLEEHAMPLLTQGYAKTVNEWFQAIPDEWRSRSYKANLAFAWMYLVQGAYNQTGYYLQQLEKILRTVPIEDTNLYLTSVRAETYTLQSLMLIMDDRLAESIELAEQALCIMPEHDESTKSLAYYSLASVYRIQEEYAKAVETFQKSIRYGRSSKNLFTEMMSQASLSQMAYEHGDLSLALELCQPVHNRIEQAEAPPPMLAVMYGVLADILYQRYRLDDSHKFILRALRMSSLGGVKSGIIYCHVVLSRIFRLQGNSQSAAREIQNAMELVAGKSPAYVLQEVAAQQVQIYLMKNNASAACMVLQEQGFSYQEQFSYPIQPLEKCFSHSLGILYNSSLHLLIHLVKSSGTYGHLEEAITLANILIECALNGQYKTIAIESYLLRARLYMLKNDKPANDSMSREDYLNALRLAEPEKFLAVFIEQGQEIYTSLKDIAADRTIEHPISEHARLILEAISNQGNQQHIHLDQDHDEIATHIKPEAIIEPLSDRELEVLHLMSQGLKYTEIARQLFISVNTVRYHVKAVYGKLNANNRIRAIEVARRHRIL